MQTKYPEVIGDVRGIGLMNAMELVGREKEPDKEITAALVKKALEKDLLLLTCGSEKNVIRFIPPLVVTEKEIDLAMEIVEQSFKEILA